MAYSATYSELQAIARQAVGLTATDLTEDESALIQQAPNEAVETVAQERRWPRIVKALSIALSAGDSSALLPADFQAFERDSALTHAAGSGYPPVGWVEYGEILARRAGAAITGPPQLAALGPTDDSGGAADGLLTIELWPEADASYTLAGSYRRSVRGMTGADDAPDVPVALHLAVRVATQLAARELLNKEVPVDLEQRLQRVIDRAWRVLGIPNIDNTAPLRDLRPDVGVAVGRNRELADDYPYTG